MSDADQTDYGPVIAELIAEKRLSPLGPCRADESTRPKLEALTEASVFAHTRLANRSMGASVISALWLYYDFLDESHTISQGIHTAEGSYWHGIMHRREPDYPNAKHWFRRVGEHAVFPEVNAAAQTLAKSHDGGQTAAFLVDQTAWDPSAFIDLCHAAAADDAPAHDLCRRIQLREWEILFDFCYREALK